MVGLQANRASNHHAYLDALADKYSKGKAAGKGKGEKRSAKAADLPSEEAS